MGHRSYHRTMTPVLHIIDEVRAKVCEPWRNSKSNQADIGSRCMLETIP